MRRAQVLDWGLQEQLWPHMEALRPRPSVYIPEFIAANQSTRADNLIPGTRAQQVQHAPHPIPYPLALVPTAICSSLPPPPVSLLSPCSLPVGPGLSLLLGSSGYTDQGACTTFPPTLPLFPQLEQIRKDIRDFRSRAGLDKVIVLWTANTERFCELVPGLNDTAENLLRTIQVGARQG